MVSTNDYAKLSANAYDGSFIPPGYTLVGQRFNSKSGFAAFAYRHVETGEIIIAIRGTEPSDLRDLATDAQIAADRVPQQYNDAMQFYRDISESNPEAEISLTGHSLGGALASLVAAKASADGDPVTATVFNALGAKQLLDNPEIGVDPAGDYSNITNYNTVFDPVSNLPLEQIGDVNTIHVDSFPLIPDWMEPIIATLYPALDIYFLRDQHAIDNFVNISFTGAQTWRQRIDPLALDLDGDGIETVGVQGYRRSLYFDHNEDGVRTGTSWIASDDGLLVLDRNGNGTVDGGSELFGDETPLSDGSTAVAGFAALADLDADADGKLDAADAQFTHLRVWRDFNQDGVSQSDELFTLDELRIAALNLDQTAVNQNLGNGNTLAVTGTYTKTDGATGTTGDVNLASNAFSREFETSVALTEQAKALPGMQGSGMVRDLREAASQSTELAQVLSEYAAADTKAEQEALLDSLLQAWSASSGMEDLQDRALEAGFVGSWRFGSTATDDGDAAAAVTRYESGSYGTGARALMEAYDDGQSSDYKTWLTRMSILERFNGRTFIDFRMPQVANGDWQLSVDTDSGGSTGGTTGISLYRVDVQLSDTQMQLLQQSYDALKDSVYQGLLFQTRLKPFVDGIGLTLVNGEIALDFSGMEAAMTQRVTDDAANGLVDILEFQQATNGTLRR